MKKQTVGIVAHIGRNTQVLATEIAKMAEQKKTINTIMAENQSIPFKAQEVVLLPQPISKSGKELRKERRKK
jgi:hypothetical protein